MTSSITSSLAWASLPLQATLPSPVARIQADTGPDSTTFEAVLLSEVVRAMNRSVSVLAEPSPGTEAFSWQESAWQGSPLGELYSDWLASHLARYLAGIQSPPPGRDTLVEGKQREY